MLNERDARRSIPPLANYGIIQDVEREEDLPRAYIAAASGSEIICRAEPEPIPACCAQLRVLACARSDHTAGVVMTNSIGVEVNALSGSL